MAMSPNLGDREHQKFVEDSDGNTGVRIAPDAIRSAEGNTLEINDDGWARTSDERVNDSLNDLREVLDAILFELKLMNG